MATRTVTNTNDSGQGSLRYVVDTAVPGDTIVFSSAILPAVITLATPITINKTLTVDGPGSNKLTISGNGDSNIFNVSGNQTTVVTILDISFVNGTSSAPGGAILNSGALLNVLRCVFSNNTSGVSGGAIANTDSGTLNISNSTFTGNTANDGGGIGIFSGNVTILNSSFSNNSAVNDGGALSNSGMASIMNSSFISNSAGNKGGAINNILAGTITITKTTFINNTASNGGAIFNSGGTVTVTNSNFSGNSIPVTAGTGEIIIVSSNFS